jgi:hypothetical protein
MKSTNKFLLSHRFYWKFSFVWTNANYYCKAFNVLFVVRISTGPAGLWPLLVRVEQGDVAKVAPGGPLSSSPRMRRIATLLAWLHGTRPDENCVDARYCLFEVRVLDL